MKFHFMEHKEYHKIEPEKLSFANSEGRSENIKDTLFLMAATCTV